ncbi:MAG: hypothetical protein ACKVE4_02030 [Dissulfuribacterales bacterium]
MNYEPATDAMLERFVAPDGSETFLGILDFLGNIHSETCREALQAAVCQIKDSFLQGSAMAGLLRHHHPEDIALVMDTVFDSDLSDDILLRNVLSPLGGEPYFSDLTGYGENLIISAPGKTIDALVEKNDHIKIDPSIIKNLTAFLEKKQYDDLITIILFDVRRMMNARYPENAYPKSLTECFGQDAMCMGLFEDLSKRAPRFGKIKQLPDVIAFILSAYFAVNERIAYVKALSPEAGVDDLLCALKNAGPSLPVLIQEKIKNLSDVSKLKEALTETLITWGDIWTVRIMGKMGNKEFVPDLIRVFQTADSMDYIYDNALTAIDALDESAEEALFCAVKNNELGEWESFSVLKHLPYTEAYDLAIDLWERESDDSMDSYEMFASCLKSIGDKRGIQKLQQIYATQNDAVGFEFVIVDLA